MDSTMLKIIVVVLAVGVVIAVIFLDPAKKMWITLEGVFND